MHSRPRVVNAQAGGPDAAPLILGLGGAALTASERDFFRDARPWGFILFERNLCGPPDAVRRLVAELRETVGWRAPVLIDQEGGRVQRLRPPLARNWPPPLQQAAAAAAAAAPGGADAARAAAIEAMALRYRIIGAELAGYGIDVNCVPCLDIAFPHTHPFLRNRCLGTTVEDVVARGRAVAEACLSSGVLPVVKHIPGHGRAEADSHQALPRVGVGSDVLRATDLAPFAALADLPLGMTAHVVYDALDPGRPATLSPAVLTMVRERLGFDGLLMTDDIGMGALSGPMPGRATEALAAGCDVVLHCSGALAEMEALAAAIPARMPADAGRRARAAIARRDAVAGAAGNDEVDTEQLIARLEGLVRGAKP